LHPDSIRTADYPGLYAAGGDVIFQTSAFEMFKVSGAMRLMNDKELLQSVWKAYFYMEKIEWIVNKYYDIKMEHCQKEGQRELDGKPSPIPLYDFYVIHANTGAMEACRELSEFLKETVSKLETQK